MVHLDKRFIISKLLDELNEKLLIPYFIYFTDLKILLSLLSLLALLSLLSLLS